MKYLLLSVFFLLALISCKKEESTPVTILELGSCYGGTKIFKVIPGACNTQKLDSERECERIPSDTFFPLSEEACTWLSIYCCDEYQTFPFVSEVGELVHFSIVDSNPFLKVTQVQRPCENDTSKNIVHCLNFELAGIRLESSLSEMIISLDIFPDYEGILSETPKLGAYMDINLYENTFLGNNNTDRSNPDSIYSPPFTIPIDRKNLTQPFRYEYQYLPEIEIIGKTFFEVYTHEEELKGFYTKIYYNKEFGIVSFVDETGMQWRVDM